MKVLNDEERTTGEPFIERLEQAMSKLRGQHKQQCAALIKDLKKIPEATVDYRIRLKAQGVDTTGLRGLGAAESQAATFADRVKGRGRSWSPSGLAAMMELLSWRNTDRLEEMFGHLKDWLSKATSWLNVNPNTAERAIGQVFLDTNSSTLTATVPIAGQGTTASGGMLALMNNIIGGGFATAS